MLCVESSGPQTHEDHLASEQPSNHLNNIFQVQDIKEAYIRLDDFIKRVKSLPNDNLEYLLHDENVKLRWQFNVVPSAEAIEAIVSQQRKKNPIVSKIITVNKWTQEEKVLLHWIVLKYSQLNVLPITQLVHNNVMSKFESDWCRISQVVPGRNLHQCQSQWGKAIYRTLGDAPWTTAEDSALIRVHKQYSLQGKGSKWQQMAIEVAQMLGNTKIRNAKQLRERWVNKLDPSISKSKWTKEDYLTLLYGIMKHGKRWAMVSKLMGNTRTEFQVKHKYYQLISNVKQCAKKFLNEFKNQLLMKEVIQPFHEHNQEQDDVIQKIIELEDLKVPEDSSLLLEPFSPSNKSVEWRLLNTRTKKIYWERVEPKITKLIKPDPIMQYQYIPILQLPTFTQFLVPL